MSYRPCPGTDDHARVEELFFEALAQPPSERAAFVDKACVDDRALHAEVAELLRAEEVAATFLTEDAPTN